jgi:hypothetical protein
MAPTRIAWLACTLVMLFATAEASVHRVDCAGGGDYLTIQEAVDAAADGDTVLVAACVYDEEVAVIDKHVTIEGEGWETTEVTSGGSGFTVTFDGLPSSAPESHFTDIRVTHAEPLRRCVRVGSPSVVLERCRIDQEMQVGSENGGRAEVWSCVIDEVSVGGIWGRAVVSESDIGRLVAGGGYDGSVYWCGFAESASNTIGTLLVTGGTADTQDDVVDLVQIEAHLDCYSVLDAVDGSFGEFRVNGGGDISVARCEMDSIVYRPDVDSYLQLNGCLVRGGFRGALWDWYGIPLWVDLIHNTILGDFSYELPSCPFFGQIFSNIVTGSVDISEALGAEFRSNDILGDINAPGATLVDNISEDPLFCEEQTGEYTLQDCSPCLGAAHDGGDIGAFGEGCECYVAVEDASWGSIKALYR